jgi:hypothetical protein
VKTNRSNKKTEQSDAVQVLRLFIGIIGSSLIVEGFNLITKAHTELLLWITEPLGGIFRIVVGFLLVIVAIKPSTAKDALKAFMDYVNEKT